MLICERRALLRLLECALPSKRAAFAFPVRGPNVGQSIMQAVKVAPKSVAFRNCASGIKTR